MAGRRTACANRASESGGKPVNATLETPWVSSVFVAVCGSGNSIVGE